MPLITVIVPIYNSETTIEKCVDSILSQSFSDFQLVLIDDGSADESGNKCDRYIKKDSRVTVAHKENGGVSSARNLGLRYAKGQWITFADSDDYVGEKWLETFVDNIDQDAQLVIQGYNEIKEDKINHIGENYLGNTQNGLLSINGHIGYLWCKLFNAQIIKDNDIHFNEDFPFCEDEDFVLKYISHISKICCIKDGFYNYYCPDLSTKYLNVDNFYSACSRFESIKKIYGIAPKFNKLYYSYLNKVCNSFFYTGFFTGGHNVSRTKMFLETTRGLIRKCNISVLTKLSILILRRPVPLCLFFKFKDNIRKFCSQSK